MTARGDLDCMSDEAATRLAGHLRSAGYQAGAEGSQVTFYAPDNEGVVDVLTWALAEGFTVSFGEKAP